jgi:hypothetical protein
MIDIENVFSFDDDIDTSGLLSVWFQSSSFFNGEAFISTHRGHLEAELGKITALILAY